VLDLLFGLTISGDNARTDGGLVSASDWRSPHYRMNSLTILMKHLQMVL